MHRGTAIVALALLAGCPDERPEAPATWTTLQPAGALPSRDFGAAVVADPASGRLIVFGGARTTTSGHTTLNDAWILIGADGSAPPAWSQIAAAGPQPPARHSHGGVYHAASNRLIVFGGCSGDCLPALADVWVLQNANGLGGAPAWTSLSPIGTPPAPRQSFAMAYDPSLNRLIVYGGHDGEGSGVAGHTFGDAFALTNANGLGGTPRWEPLDPSGTAPAGRYGPAAAYQERSRRLWIIGGFSDAEQRDDVNALSNVDSAAPAWNAYAAQGAPSAPVYVFSSPAFFDHSRARVLLLSYGSFGGALTLFAFKDVSWTLRETTNFGPSDAGIIGAGYFPSRGRVVALTNTSGANALWVLE